MTDQPTSSDPDLSAAEHALRLLTGAEAQHAQDRAAADPAFAQEVARWRGRLASLDGGTAAVMPPAGVWERVAAETALTRAANDNYPALRRQLRAWKAAAATLGAIAASLALMLAFNGYPSATTPATSQPANVPLVAQLGNDGQDAVVVASWSPGERQLVLVVPGALPADPAHSHELWVIPADGKPRSMGTMLARKQMHMRLDEVLAKLLAQGATIAISVEPRGGSRTGQPTGPVIASGKLNSA